MSITKHLATRRVRTALVTTVAAGAGLASLLGMSGAASASTAQGHINGWVVATSCTSVSGKISYSPGLRSTKLKAEHAVLTGTTSGCSNIFDGALSGTGTVTAILSGTASKAAENFSGTFTINWPASSGYNPSNGNVTVSESNGLETVSGSVTSGFETGGEFAMQYVITGGKGSGTKAHPVVSQNYTNTQSLTLSVNEG